MKRGVIVTAVILLFLIIAIKSNAETKITPGGVTFPDNSTQSKAWTVGEHWWFEDICYNPVGALGGRVGIGTSSPAAKLHIKGNDFPYTFIYLDTNAANQDAGIRFYENSFVKGHLYHDASEGLLRLEANQAQLVLSSSDGNVGIGTTGPDEKLEVAGNIKVSGAGNGIKFPNGSVQTAAAAPPWYQLLPANNGEPGTGCNSSRFQCVMNNQAVLDNEMGLVWELAPYSGEFNLADAQIHCARGHGTSTRMGWRLPQIDELTSLIDYTVTTFPRLPPGHPFQIIVTLGNPRVYSATATLDDDGVLVLTMNTNDPALLVRRSTDLAGPARAWCVRPRR